MCNNSSELANIHVILPVISITIRQCEGINFNVVVFGTSMKKDTDIDCTVVDLIVRQKYW